MKIYIISPQYIGATVDGCGFHVIELSRELLKLGHMVTIITMRVGDLLSEENIQLSDPNEPNPDIRTVTVSVIRLTVDDTAKISDPLEGTKCEEIDRMLQFNKKTIEWFKHNTINQNDAIIHIHGHSIVPAMAATLRTVTNIPIVSSIHIFESMNEARKGENGADAEIINTLQKYEQQAIRSADHIIIRSNSIYEQMAAVFPDAFIDQEVTVLPSGIASSFIHRPPLSDTEIDELRMRYAVRGRLLFNLNRIDPAKGIEYIINAMPIIGRTMKEREGDNYQGMTLIIAGMYEEKYEWYLKALEEHIEKAELNHYNINIAIHRNISEQDKIGLFQMASLFIMPSIMESFGISLVEALSKEVPCVVAGVEGPLDIMNISDFKGAYTEAPGGLLVAWYDPSRRKEYLATACIHALSHYDIMKTLAQEGKQRVLQLYAWNILVNSDVEIYKDTIHKNK